MKTIVLVGQPNCGKSALFNAIAGYKANSSNFPGTTVQILRSQVIYRGETFDLVDLPGTYSLTPFDKAEEVTFDFLLTGEYDLILNVLDASRLNRSLELALELQALEKPTILVLNMMDEAEKKGMTIDSAALGEFLGMSAFPTTALSGKGVEDVLKAALGQLENPSPVRPLPFPPRLESFLAELTPFVGAGRVNSRFLALKALEGGEMEKKIPVSPGFHAKAEELSGKVREFWDKSLQEVLFAERHHLSMELSEKACRIVRRQGRHLSERVDALFCHPLFGYLLFVVVFLLMLALVFRIGNLLETLSLAPLNELALWVGNLPLAPWLHRLADGIVAGTVGAVGIIVPYMVPLLLMMAILEDSGYLARSAFLFDSLMHKMGLHGKSLPPLLMAFGCNVPALSATRILESPRDRLLTALLIPFIPCSARTIVISALVYAFLGTGWAFFVYGVTMITVFFLSLLLSSLVKYPAPGLIMEIPAFRVPSPKNVLIKAWFQLKPFLVYAIPLLVLGSIAVEYVQFFGLERLLNALVRPVTYLLDLPEATGFTLVFGFFRKELALLMLGQSLGVSPDRIAGVLSSAQLITFALFTTLYIPCLSTFLILRKEFNLKTAWISIGLNVAVSLGVTLSIVSLLRLTGLL